ncbi:pfkB-like carbohydrate kinase family protein [Actinidia rufa]|uniref:PfkB-like carbohydrate kinase family protein n=1 Tax=Actinidia rufa TaxID=165716 RepID=A0A7J0F8V7_9ERIC|nr:pfkB-like carbohydrate kinase family protein [Actinidia rufa]
MEGSVWRQMGSLHLGLGEDHGQVKDEEAEAVIIGGMGLDIHATPSMPANPRTTTPGKACLCILSLTVHYILGGVARNVAECMSKLGARPYMISALGLDMAGNLLLEHWKSAGLSIEGIQRHQDIETAVVSNIFDVKGELAAAVASVESIEKFLTPQWIQQSNCIIHSAPVVMVDANLTPPALEASCRMAAESDIPVWFEPVSVAKSKRIVSVVEHITFASPNEDELIAMANALPAIFVLLEKGIKIVVVTLGSDGGRFNLFAVHFPALPASVVRLTGAGDCLVGAALACICAGLDVIQSLAVGIAAAKAAVEAETNVPPEFNMATITDDARSVYLATKMMLLPIDAVSRVK